MINTNNKNSFVGTKQEPQEKKSKRCTVWVVPYSRNPLPREPMKADQFGYDDWEIYHG